MTPDRLIKCPSEKSVETLGYSHLSLRDNDHQELVVLDCESVLPARRGVWQGHTAVR
jgi:hypothetical protein